MPDGTPVRLRETVRNAKVWVLDAHSEPVPGEMDLPEGWYCIAAARRGVALKCSYIAARGFRRRQMTIWNLPLTARYDSGVRYF